MRKIIYFLVFALLLSVQGYCKSPSGAIVNVKHYGATGDGRTNDTKAIQAAINAVTTGGIVLVPAGTYMVDVTRGNFLTLKSNMTFKMEKGATLKAIPCNSGNSFIICVWELSNVKILGGTLIGERNGHVGTTGEWGMGIGVYGSNDILIEDTTCRDCWGDGFEVGANNGTTGKKVPSRNITLSSVVGDNNRRQGLSVTSADGVVIKHSIFKNTHGTLPYSGIDVEPDKGETVVNLQILNTQCFNNAGYGICVCSINAPIDNVRIDGCTEYENGIDKIGLTDKSPATHVTITNNRAAK